MNNKSDNPGRKKSNPDLIWNVLTAVMLMGTLCAAAFFVAAFTNPALVPGFLQPPTPLPTPIPPTVTPLALQPTWTPTNTVEPTATDTPRPTFTMVPTATIFTLATATPKVPPTKTPKPTGVPYAANISYYDSTAFRPDTNCGVLLVAGQTLDSGNNPVTGLIIKLGGSVPGKVFNPPEVKLAGIATAYGPSGFEFN